LYRLDAEQQRRRVSFFGGRPGGRKQNKRGEGKQNKLFTELMKEEGDTCYGSGGRNDSSLLEWNERGRKTYDPISLRHGIHRQHPEKAEKKKCRNSLPEAKKARLTIREMVRISLCKKKKNTAKKGGVRCVTRSYKKASGPD